jgi:hypothetical protein
MAERRYVDIDAALLMSRRELLKRGYVTADKAKVKPEDEVWSWAIANALKGKFCITPQKLLPSIRALGIPTYEVVENDFDGGPEVA